MSDDTGRTDGPGRIGALVVGFSKHFAKGPAYMVFAFACLGVLGYAARANKESVASSVGILATAVFGAGAAKTFVDQKFGGGQ